jgi:hypothetical protein
MPDISVELSEIFHAFFDYLEEIDRMLNITTFSLHGMKGRGELAEVATRGRRGQKNPFLTTEKLDEDGERYVQQVRKLEELALSQAADDFLMLYAHASVLLWSSLEATIPDLVVQALSENRQILENAAFLKVKLPVAVLNAQPEDQIASVISELERQMNAPLKRGVGRFSVLLDAVGLGFEIDEDSRRTLLELSQARNNIVHRFSVVDKHFKDACPWLLYQPGDRLKITCEDYMRYKTAVVSYVRRIVDVFEKRLEQ